MSTNEITGDKLVSKPATEAYAAGFDRIFKSNKLPPREKVARFIEWQLRDFVKPLGSCHHYGRQELYALMDFLYGEAPTKPEEGLFYVSPEAQAANKKQMDDFIKENLRCYGTSEKPNHIEGSKR